MYWQFLVVVVAVCWLARRVYTLATLPLDQLVKTLAVDIPRAATISVDNITDTEVDLHWDKPPKEPELQAASTLVFINGNRVASLSGRDSHIHISGLLPNTKYQIDLVTVNHKRYKAKSRPVYIQTKSTQLQRKSHSHASENPLENPETLFKMLTENAELSVEKLPTITVTTPAGENGDASMSATPNGRRGPRSRSNTINSTFNDIASTAAQSMNMLPDPKSIQDIEELRYYLESGQEELHTVLNQQSQILQEFKEQELLLFDQRKQLRERKKLEDNDRSLVKSQINNLDESRRNAELKKSKQEAMMQNKRKLIEKMTRELDEWSIKMNEFEQEKVHIETSEDKVHEELDTDIEKKKDSVKKLQASITALDDEIKKLLARKKQREQNRPQLLKIFKTIGRHTDSIGLLDQEGVQNLALLSSIDPALWEKVNKEVLLDSQLEAQWRAEQQRTASNCEKANLTKKTLQNEVERLNNGQIGSGELTGAVPALSSLHLTGSSQALPTLNGNGVAYQQIPSPSNNNSSNNSFNNGYFSGSVSPPSVPAMLHSQSQSSNGLQSSLWNSTGLSLSYKPTTRLSLTTNMKSTDLLPQEDMESPSIDHFLPTDLITEQFNDMSFPMSPDMNNSTGSDGVASGQGSTPINTNVSLLAGSAAGSFNQNMHFPGEFNNLSSRSIFHNDFGMAPSSLRPSMDNPSSPPLSFQNEFLSAHNSPATNNNDIASIFSGGNVDVLPTFSQTSGETKNPATHKSAFSPRRLSSVFGFGNKNKNSAANSMDAVTSGMPGTATVVPSPAGPKQSKFFFHRSQNSDLDPLPPAPEPPLFKFDQTTQAQSASNNSAFNILDVWSSPFGGDNNDEKHIVEDQKLEHSSRVWSNQPTEVNTSGDSKFLGVPSSSNSLSSQAVSDAVDLGPVVQLTSTNKSAKSTKSKSSVEGSSNAGVSTNSPSGLFRRKSGLLNFGHKKTTQPVEKSPVRQHIPLSRMESPTRIDSHDDGEVEEFAPTATSSKKLFSRRMSFNTNIRKQSNSSHETDSGHGQDQNSVQSGSTTNSRSIVRKLSLFGNKMNGGKDTNVIDEHDDEDER